MVRTQPPERSKLALVIIIGVTVSIGAAAVASVSVPVITAVDDEVTGYGTFQSHNQKVVETADGIFMTYARTPFDDAQWRLVRSTDEGRSFETIWQGVNSTHPPAIEASADGKLYLVHGDQATGAAYFYRLSPATAFAQELI